MKNVINSIIQDVNMPETWKEANMALIFKEGQKLDLTKNYRPVSLLNKGYKLFTMILADKLKIILQEFIHDKQYGFLPQRSLKGYFRTTLDILEYLQQHNKK